MGNKFLVDHFIFRNRGKWKREWDGVWGGRGKGNWQKETKRERREGKKGTDNQLTNGRPV